MDQRLSDAPFVASESRDARIAGVKAFMIVLFRRNRGSNCVRAVCVACVAWWRAGIS
jgi:hypothetical protein